MTKCVLLGKPLQLQAMANQSLIEFLDIRTYRQAMEAKRARSGIESFICTSLSSSGVEDPWFSSISATGDGGSGAT